MSFQRKVPSWHPPGPVWLGESTLQMEKRLSRKPSNYAVPRPLVGFVCRCAMTRSGHPAAPPSPAMNSRRLGSRGSMPAALRPREALYVDRASAATARSGSKCGRGDLIGEAGRDIMLVTFAAAKIERSL
jgi:hypothetical protein